MERKRNPKRVVLTVCLIILLAPAAALAARPAAFLVRNAFVPKNLRIARVSWKNGDETGKLSLAGSIRTPYLALDTDITLHFSESAPQWVTVTEIITRSDGSRRYNRQSDRVLDLVRAEKTVTFRVEANISDLLSSNSRDYAPKSSWRHYLIALCEGDEIQEYELRIRTDPAMIFEQ